MSRAGNPHDNAVMESFWGRFKDALRKHFRYWERDDLSATIEEAVYYFNNERPVRKLQGKPPVLFRTELVACYLYAFAQDIFHVCLIELIITSIF